MNKSKKNRLIDTMFRYASWTAKDVWEIVAQVDLSDVGTGYVILKAKENIAGIYKIDNAEIDKTSIGWLQRFSPLPEDFQMNSQIILDKFPISAEFVSPGDEEYDKIEKAYILGETYKESRPQ